MASKHVRRGTLRLRSIEILEERRPLAADSFAQLLGGSVEQHGFSDLADEPPALVRHDEPNVDLGIDSSSDHRAETLLLDIEPTLTSAHDATGLTQVRSDYGFIGTGQTVAIIDSGVAWDHFALGGGFGANYRVVGGWDFTQENDANPYDDGPAGSHGTHVAGIVGADRSGTSDDGVVPGVNLVALRVFNDAGVGDFSLVENALQWVHANRNDFANPITAVNLSLGAAWNSTTLPAWANLEDEFAQLETDGIFITVSAGDAFPTYDETGLSYPAASPHVVPVMSVNDDGTFSPFSQRHPSAIAAPGQNIVSAVPDYAGNINGVTDDFASFSGSRMAAPYVAGASVIVREAMEFVGYTNITQDTIFDHMMATATTFFDSATSLNYKRLNLANALDALMPSDDYGSTSGTAYNLGSVGVGGAEVNGLIGKLSDVDYFHFTAAVTGTITVTAATTHNLAAEWIGAGTVSGNDGEIFTFNVVAGQSYNFGIATGNGLGYYDFDMVVAGLALPTLPGAFQATATSPTQVALSWSDSTGETNYQIARWSAETGTVVAGTVGANVTNFTATGLPAGSRQFFQISARNAAGAATTAWQLVEMPPADPPTLPGAFQATATSPTQVALSWSDSTGETNYQIARWSAETGTVVAGTVGANVTNFTVTGLPAGSRQFFQISARNAAGAATTAWQLVEMPPADPPTLPGAFQATATSPTQVALSWSDSTGETNYQIARWSAETGTVVAGTVGANVTNFTATGLPAGSRQFFQISARNAAGTATTAWQLVEMPPAAAGSTIGSFVASGIHDALNVFSIDAAQFTSQFEHESLTGRFQYGGSSTDRTDGDVAPRLRNVATIDSVDGSNRLMAFGELGLQEGWASPNVESAKVQLFDVLAESRLIGIDSANVDRQFIERFWQDW